MTPIGEPFEPGEDDHFEAAPGYEGEGPEQELPVPARPACRPLTIRRDTPPRR